MKREKSPRTEVQPPEIWSPKVLGSGVYEPEHVVPNSVIEEMLKLRPGFIERTVGVEQRRSCFDPLTRKRDFEVPEVEMAIRAATAVIEKSSIDPQSITAVVFGEGVPSKIPDWQHEELVFSLAVAGVLDEVGIPKYRKGSGRPSILQFLDRMNLRGVRYFQAESGCADVHYLLSCLSPVFRKGGDRVLVVSSSAASNYARLFPHKDLNEIITQSIFGDLAAAVILDFGVPGIQPFITTAGCDPEKEIATSRRTSEIRNYPEDWGLYINHQLVLQEAPKAMVGVVRELLHQSGLGISDVDRFLFHQPSGQTYKRTVELLKMEFGEIPNDKIPTNFQRLGNTDHASTFALLDEGLRSGSIKPGDTVLFSVAGAGFKWAGMILKV